MKKAKKENKENRKCKKFIHSHCMNTVSEHHTQIVQPCNMNAAYCDFGRPNEKEKR